jgi:hypothetical protein
MKDHNNLRADYIATRKAGQQAWRTALKKKTCIATRIEMHEVWVITRPETTPVLCDLCPGQQSSMIAPQEAAALAGVSLRTIFRWVEAGQVHYLEQADGLFLICLNSMPGPQTAAVRALLPSA